MASDASTDTESRPEEANPSKKPVSAADEFIEIIKTIVYALLIALVLRVLLFQPFTIPSGSMIPNLLVGDYIIVTKYSYGYSKHSVPFSPPLGHGRILARHPHRGDIVVFKDTKDDRTDYIKRLIGLPGDHIQMVNGQLWINGKPLPQEAFGHGVGDNVNATLQHETNPEGKTYVTQDLGYTGGDDTQVYTVPEGYYFFMGDNRDNSSDSRFSTEAGGISYVPAENLVGKAQFILFSWNGASLFKPWTWFTDARWGRFFHKLD